MTNSIQELLATKGLNPNQHSNEKQTQQKRTRRRIYEEIQDDNSMANSAIVNSAIENEPQPNNGFTVEKFTIAKKAIVNSTKAHFAIEKNTIENLAIAKNGFTKFDNFIFDSLLSEIKDATSAIVYLYLWRRTYGFQKNSVKLSHQMIANAIGMSKRAVQSALKKLTELNLISTTKPSQTSVPEHRVNKTWDSIAKDAIAESTIAVDDSCYSRINHNAIAEFATNKRKQINLKETLSVYLKTLKPQKKQKGEREALKRLNQEFEDADVEKAFLFLKGNGFRFKDKQIHSPLKFLEQGIQDVLSEITLNSGYAVDSKTVELFETLEPATKQTILDRLNVPNGLSTKESNVIRWSLIREKLIEMEVLKDA